MQGTAAATLRPAIMRCPRSETFRRNRCTGSAPLCQEDVEITFLGNVFGLLEEVSRENGVGVEDFDADETVVLPVEGDPGFDAGWRARFGRGVATRELLVGEVYINGVGLSVVGDAHGTSLA
jgi:hypothetical protein